MKAKSKTTFKPFLLLLFLPLVRTGAYTLTHHSQQDAFLKNKKYKSLRPRRFFLIIRQTDLLAKVDVSKSEVTKGCLVVGVRIGAPGNGC